MGVVAAGGLPARLLVAGALALACLLVSPATASAIEFTVNSLGDAGDAVLEDELCAASGGDCTLRAAIEESNALEEGGRIDFDEARFEGRPADTIILAGDLPTVTRPLELRGRQCPTAFEDEGPCVGVDAAAADVALRIESEDVMIEGLAITGAETAIAAQGPRFKLFNSWIGVRLDGTAVGNGNGVLVGAGSTRSRIGQATSTSRNVFASIAGTALKLVGLREATVAGNYFGVLPDGITPAGNGTNIEIASAAEGAVAEGTVVGGRVDQQAAASPRCDGACNVISAATAAGVDLAGDEAGEEPPVETLIAANHIGLDASGTAAIPNGAVGVRVGGADSTSIGGPARGDVNQLSGGQRGVEAGLPSGQAADDLLIQGMRIGVAANGAPVAPPSEAGIWVDSFGVASAIRRALILDNQVRMSAGTAIRNDGLGAWIAGNQVTGAVTGIAMSGGLESSNTVERNAISAVSGNAILIENDLNEIVANKIVDTGTAAIRIDGTAEWRTQNLVGGDSPADENVIQGSGGAAIEIVNPELGVNEVGRNRGAGNAGPFIDLMPASPGQSEGPNLNLEPPIIASATTTGVAGEARSGARVRVFRKAGTEPGEIAGFLGEATADEKGEWALAFVEPLAGGAVAATQTEGGATSELRIAAVTGVEGEPGPGDGGSPGGGASTDAPFASDELLGAGRRRAKDRKRPHTAIFGGPRAPLARGVARFTFGSNEFRTRFACALDGGRFRRCLSPKVFRGLDPGRHVFRVRAIDAAGNVDPTPARWGFTVRG